VTYTVHVTHTIGDLARDLAQVPVKAAKECQGIVRDGAKAGAILARANAERTAGAHGKHYPKSITSEQRKPFMGFGASVFSAEYGPDAAKLQGGMSFEYGSRNQPPHLDLARSADVIGPSLGQEVRQMLDRLFW
jgi:hypothetical protein